MKPKSAHKVLHNLADKVLMDNMLHGRNSIYNRKYPKVGSVIESLPESDREALKNLTSQEASNIRIK